MPDALWCPRCFLRVLPVEGAAELVHELSNHDDQGRYEATTMGPMGRIAVMAGLVLVWAIGISALLSAVLGRIGVVVFVVVTSPGLWIVVSATWKRERAPVRLGRPKSCRVCRLGLEADAASCPRCLVQVA
jgi:hypothetical protein